MIFTANPRAMESYWLKGCNDAKSGKPMDEVFSKDEGYRNGFDYGQGRPRSIYHYTYDTGPFNDLEEGGPALRVPVTPDPPLKNPYDEATEKIDGIVARLHKFSQEFPKTLDTRKAHAYSADLSVVRSLLQRLRQKELAGE